MPQEIVRGRLGGVVQPNRRDSSSQITTIDATVTEDILTSMAALQAATGGGGDGSSASTASGPGSNQRRRRSSLAQLTDILSFGRDKEKSKHRGKCASSLDPI